MITANVLVDFDNFADFRSFGRKLNQPDVDRQGNKMISDILSSLTKLDIKPNELTIRLYSGWHSEKINDYNNLFYMTAAFIKNTPKTRNKIRIKLSMADSPAYDKSILFTNTHRHKYKLPPFQITKNCCEAGTNCSLTAVKKWQRGKCPNQSCVISQQDAFYYQEQKIVDTLIVSDALYYAHARTADWIIIISNDDDIVPGVLFSKQMDANPILIRHKNSSAYDNYLEANSIPIVNICR